MVDISEKEYREYIDLKRKEAERQKRLEELIKKGPKELTKWRTDLHTFRGKASVFANVLEKEWVRRGQPAEFVLDRFKSVINYLSDELLYIKKNKVNIKPVFRNHLRNFGWSLKIDYKYGLLIVKKIDIFK